jgi:signal transduction histidine kinase
MKTLFFNVFNRTHVVLFLLFLGISMFFITILYVSFNMNWDRLFMNYQQELLKVNAYKLADDIRNEQMLSGPFTEEQASWLTRRSKTYGVLMRYRSMDERVWFDTLDRPGAPGFGYYEIPVIYDGRQHGKLAVSYLSNTIDLDPVNLSYRQAMERRSKMVFVMLLALSIVISFIVSRKLSSYLVQIINGSAKIRVGKWSTRIKVGGTRELRLVATTLNEMARELEKHEEWRKQLMEDLAHEVRTPLTSMHTQLEAMIDGMLTVDQKRLLGIYEEVERLKRLVTDMERLSDAEGSRFALNIKTMNIVQLSQHVYNAYLPLARDKMIKFTFDNPHIPCYAEVDGDKMIQVISNVVSNAIKYTPEFGTVSLGVGRSEETDETYIVCTDNGIGISEEDLPHIFKRLYRADKSRSRFSGGLGLGLSIADALANAHDGRIEVTSRIDEGSTFIITIPNEYRNREELL